MSKPAEIATSIGNRNHCGLLVVWPKVGLGCAVKRSASHAPLSSMYIYIYIHALWAFPKSEGNCPQKKCCELMIGWMILGATIGGNRHMDHPPFGV